MRIDALYDNFNSMNNTSQAGFVRPVADFIPAIHTISIEIFNILVKQQTKTQQVKDALLPFKKSANVSVSKMGNEWVAKYPDDYKAYEAGGIITVGKKVIGDKNCSLWDGKEWKASGLDAEDFEEKPDEEFKRYPLTEVAANKWNSVTSHPTRKPKFDKPYITQRGSGFEVAPGNEIGVIVIDYYRLPKEPKFNYKEVRDDPDVYLKFEEIGSEHLEWGDEMIPAFLYKLSKRFGYMISDELKLQVTSIDKSIL